MEYEYEELKKKYDALPDDIREAMSSVDIAQSVENIGKSHSLHVDQIGQLMDEVSFIMLGLMHPSDFISNIQKSLEIDNQVAQEITKDINEKIFRPIKASLLSIHGVDNKESESGIRNQESTAKQDVGEKVEGRESDKSDYEYNKLPPKGIIEEKPLPEIAPKDIVEEKLGGEFKIPSTEQEVTEPEPEKISAQVDKPVDPYREPIE